MLRVLNLCVNPTTSKIPSIESGIWFFGYSNPSLISNCAKDQLMNEECCEHLKIYQCICFETKCLFPSNFLPNMRVVDTLPMKFYEGYHHEFETLYKSFWPLVLTPYPYMTLIECLKTKLVRSFRMKCGFDNL